MKGRGRYAQDYKHVKKKHVEALDEWEELALLSDKTIPDIRRLSGRHSLRRKAMVFRWAQRKELEPNWNKLEKALVSASQEPHAAKISLRARLRAPMDPAITATSSGNLKESSDHGSEKGIEEFIGL